MFDEGDHVAVRGEANTFDGELYREDERVATVEFAQRGRSAELTLGDRSWILVGYGRGWRVAAFDRGGRVAAAYADRWLFAGRIWVGDAIASLHVPLAWRSWTLRVDGDTALVLDRAGWGLSGRVGRTPTDTDTELLVSFAMAVVWTRVRFRVRPMRSVHVVEEHAETLDMLLDGDPDFDGDDDAF